MILIVNSDELGVDFEATEGDWMIAKTSELKIDLQLRRILSDLQNHKIPNLIGMNLTDAIYLLENHGLKVEFFGTGSVKKQSMKKGEEFIKGTVITLELA